MRKGSGAECFGVRDICCIVEEIISSAASFVSNNPNSGTGTSLPVSSNLSSAKRDLLESSSYCSITKFVSFAYFSNLSWFPKISSQDNNHRNGNPSLARWGLNTSHRGWDGRHRHSNLNPHPISKIFLATSSAINPGTHFVSN